MISIRPASPNDLHCIRRVIVDAFSGGEFGHHGEADIVDKLRKKTDQSLSLVASLGRDIVGHILFSRVAIRMPNGEFNGMGLGPMAVAPAHQRTGIGSALVESGLNELSEDGCPFVVVLGHPKYYSRFGFELAARHGIVHGFDGITQDVFFIRFLGDEAMYSVAGGTAVYAEEFGDQFEGTNL